MPHRIASISPLASHLTLRSILRRSTGRLRQRRGAVLVMVALAMTFIMAMMAFVIELSRLMSNASELQSLTDASALAGAYGLQKVRDASYTTIADSTASLNKVEGASQAVVYRYGKWDGTNLDTSGAVTLANADAVQATATFSATHFFGGLVGTTNGYSIKRSSIAWAGGSINSTSCLKPWAVPLAALKVQLGYPANDVAPLTEADIMALNSAAAHDTLTIKHGGGASQGTVTAGTITVPGAFGAVRLAGNGARDYQDSIEDQSCSQPVIRIGDQVTSEQGNMAGPTRDGVCSLCDCASPHGQSDFVCSPPYSATVIVYSAVTPGGLPQYTVGYFGVFKITGYHGAGQDDQVIGTFSGVSAPGEGFSPIPGPVTKLVLVK
jgi:Flp pilus assembly protein TadG